MAYPITLTDGTSRGTIVDGTVNSSATSLTLIGKNYAGYGNFLNENYIKILENFSYGTPPNAPLKGQLWYDSDESVLKVYNGSIWKPISSSANTTTAPTSPVTGDIWWDPTNSQLKVWSGTAWITIGPTYTTTSGTSGPLVESITDSAGMSHIATKFYISNTIVAILSKDAEYTPGAAIAGFTTIKPGFNLISASALTGSQFTGDVSNALTLQGVNASQFLRSDQNTSTAYTITAGGGVTIGSDLAITPTPATNEVQLNNSTLNRDINVYVNSANTKTRVIGITGSTAAVAFGNSDVTIGKTLGVTGNVNFSAYTSLAGKLVAADTIVPLSANTVNIGESTKAFNNIYAVNFVGNISATAITIGGLAAATQPFVSANIQLAGYNSQGVKTVSASAPTGGVNGDIWYRI